MLKNLAEKKTVIISMIGKSRIGKSTFINTLITFLENKNCKNCEVSNKL
jgi:putative ribosome biogenesis GTPase RsgA